MDVFTWRTTMGSSCPRRIAVSLCLIFFAAGNALPAFAVSATLAMQLGAEHTCGVLAGGRLKCWGTNWTGQLGDGTNVHRNAPVDVVGLSSGVSMVATGSEHTCAVVDDGRVKCWGTDWMGQLGDGANVNRNTPVDVVGLPSGAVAIATGSEHTCVILADGRVMCWGANGTGQLGDGTNVHRNTPVDVGGLPSGAIAIAAGSEHSCAVLAGGQLKCWGANWTGQLGDGTNAHRNTPVDVAGLSSGVVGIAAGAEHTCAVLGDGRVKCWGTNGTGQLGDGTNVSHNTPADVVGLVPRVTALATGSEHSCALTARGSVHCWGTNWMGQLGDGSNHNRNLPVDVAGMWSGVVEIATGAEHTCALTARGAMRCWGTNWTGQLGDGTNVSRNAPVEVIGLPTTRPWVSWRFL
jgi:alpha-tubulin suppressor-like RCC1 family protein